MGKRSEAWKDHERATAKALGGVRVGPSGKATADIVTAWAVVECKERATLPAWLTDPMFQVKRAAAAFVDGRLPLVRWHALGSRRADDIYCVRAADFEAWFGGFPADPAE